MLMLIILLIIVNNLSHVVTDTSNDAETGAFASSSSTPEGSFATATAFAKSSSSATECSPAQCKKNEEYSKCPNKVCRAKTCNELGFPLPCLQPKGKNMTCGQPGCICKEGYVKNKKGLCVRSRDCPSCGGDKNAWAGCGVFCTRCSNYKNKDRICATLCEVNGCDCRPKYVYDERIKKCVLPEKCPKCNKNEEYSTCPNKECRAQKCDELGFPLACNQVPVNSTDCGKPGCICKLGYVRDKCSDCIDSSECPSCGGDPNAEPGCGTFCIRCDNYMDEGRGCSQVCWENGCACRKNYVYESRTKKCVLPENCPKCNKNEEYSTCPNKECRAQKCDELGFPLACNQVPVNSTDCGKPGCICKLGYVRDECGDCIDSSECPSCGGDPNAEPGCGNFCIRCDNYMDEGRGCSQACWENGCTCRKNYVYESQTKKCVLLQDCPCTDKGA